MKNSKDNLNYNPFYYIKEHVHFLILQFFYHIEFTAKRTLYINKCSSLDARMWYSVHQKSLQLFFTRCKKIKCTMIFFSFSLTSVSINTRSSTMTSSKAKQNLFSVMIKKLDWQYDEIIKNSIPKKTCISVLGFFYISFHFSALMTFFNSEQCYLPVTISKRQYLGNMMK